MVAKAAAPQILGWSVLSSTFVNAPRKLHGAQAGLVGWVLAIRSSSLQVGCALVQHVGRCILFVGSQPGTAPFVHR
jgi:hypothetical protein